MFFPVFDTFVNCLKAYCNKDGEGVYYKCKEHVKHFTNKTAIISKPSQTLINCFFNHNCEIFHNINPKGDDPS